MPRQFYQLTSFKPAGLKRTRENDFKFMDVDHGYCPQHQLRVWLEALAQGISR
jgi:hypothetical protein